MSLTVAPTQSVADGTRLITRRLGFLDVTTVSGPAQPLVGLPAGGDTAPHLLLGVHTRGRARLTRDGIPQVHCPGDLFVTDGSAPCALHEFEDFELHLVRIPRSALTLTDAQVHGLVRRAPRDRGSVAPLLAALLRTLVTEFPECSQRTALHVAGGIAELVTVLAAEDAAPEPKETDKAPRVLTRRIRSHINDNLRDRGLSPGAVAAAHHISTRQLHKLFAAHGLTISRWIQHRRLEEARREMARPGGDDTSVSAVARRWGFANAAHFSRNFRLAYGMPPSQWRAVRTRMPDRTTN